MAFGMSFVWSMIFLIKYGGQVESEVYRFNPAGARGSGFEAAAGAMAAAPPAPHAAGPSWRAGRGLRRGRLAAPLRGQPLHLKRTIPAPPFHNNNPQTTCSC